MILPLEIIKYFVLAKGRHGIHSPFVYDFVDKCLKIDLPPLFINQRAALFSKLKSSNTSIAITDFGAGSKKLKSSRKVQSIFNISSSKGKYGDLLYKLSHFYKPGEILELGTSIGIGSIHLKTGFPEANVTTVEGCTETLSVAIENFNDLDLTFQTINETFHSFLSKLTSEKYDLIFIDGHHDGLALKDYLEKLKPHAHNDTIFILDDIRWSSSMFEAWNEIIQSDNFHVTIDLFRLGIVIPKKQQTKQHFMIRY